MIELKQEWLAKPINRTCEVENDQRVACNKPTVAAYPAMGGGWMALCEQHAKKHLPNVYWTGELIAKGARWK